MAENQPTNEPLEIPAGKMRVWDPEQKKVILVDAPPAPDHLTLTVRLHDPKEKKNAKLSASWHVISIPREDLALTPPEFALKYLIGAVEQLEHFKK